MSSINNGASCIPILQGPQNYQFWSMRMQGFLSMIMTPGTPLTGWTVTQGIVPTLPSIASLIVEECRWNFLEQSAIGMLIQAVPDSMLRLIIQGDPNNTWEGLQHLYGIQGPTSVYGDFVCAISWSLPGNMDLAQSITELESLFTWIEGMTARLPEVIHAMILLRTVPQGMETLVQSILANQTQMSQLTWDLPQQQPQQQQPPNQGTGQKPGNNQPGNPSGDGKKGKRGKRGGKKGKGTANEATTDADTSNSSGVTTIAPQYGASSAIGFAAPAIANCPLLANQIASLAELANAGPLSSTCHLVAEA
ncbi:hypothetical protein D9756_011428 [Leucocoprinus leucothites]|uniref:Uncharacterized protein n=1 Tax=Leucocoprinus leucothites TaxID=201217 RepID=A0A8H5FNR0_9AGAR|nr:hypothetical protein D9756_011428 [Leucoagaricus leucothites]